MLVAYKCGPFLFSSLGPRLSEGCKVCIMTLSEFFSYQLLWSDLWPMTLVISGTLTPSLQCLLTHPASFCVSPNMKELKIPALWVDVTAFWIFLWISSCQYRLLCNLSLRNLSAFINLKLNWILKIKLGTSLTVHSQDFAFQSRQYMFEPWSRR